MTNEQAVEMMKAKLECMTREVSGTDRECNAKRCDECDLCYAQGNMGEQKECLRMSIKALEQQPCEDAISRQAVLDIWHTTYSDNREENEETQYKKIAFELSPVTPQPKWIPISERLPNNHECKKNDGLFNVSDGNRSYFGWFDIYNTKKFVKPTIAGFCVDNAVTAWMPLPEPCKAESEE